MNIDVSLASSLLLSLGPQPIRWSAYVQGGSSLRLKPFWNLRQKTQLQLCFHGDFKSSQGDNEE